MVSTSIMTYSRGRGRGRKRHGRAECRTRAGRSGGPTNSFLISVYGETLVAAEARDQLIFQPGHAVGPGGQ